MTDFEGQQQLTVDAKYAQAIDHYNAESYTKADQLCTSIIQAVPNHVDAINLLGVIAQRLNRNDLAILQFQKAIAIDNKNAWFYYNLGVSFNLLGKIIAAIKVLKLALEIEPANSKITNYLIEIFDNLTSINENFSSQEKIELIFQTAIFFQNRSQLDVAVHLYRKILQNQPDNAVILSNLGLALKGIGELQEAEAILLRATSINQNFAEAFHNLGIIKKALGNFSEAITCLRKAIAIKPEFATAHYDLGVILQEQGVDEEEVVLCYQKAIDIKPDYAEAYRNLGVALQAQGESSKAITCHRKAISISPNNPHYHINLIFCIDLFAGTTSELPMIERNKWAKKHAEHLQNVLPPVNNRPNPNKILRVGYVGADFKQHSAAHIFGPMLLNYDTTQYQIFCYAGNDFEDDLTEQFKQKAMRWLSTSKIDDATLAEQIRKDNIDILVDLAGHTKGNRLLTFARKPAPIQVTAWGYPLGTAMAAMDYIFADPFIITQSKRGGYVEQIVDLPCVIHMQSNTPFPKVTDPPACKNGYVTFGAFNRFDKYSDDVFNLWAEILRRIPDAKLLLKSTRLDSPNLVIKTQLFFQDRGVSKNRLIFIGKTSRDKHLESHALIDIMLDPYPHPSGMTSLESLRMGVPVLNCEAELRYPISSSLLHILNMDEWRSKDKDDYIEKAVHFANDIEHLKTLRHQLRERFDKSVLGNSELYTKEVETIYRNLWKKWCKEQKS
ncbi:MAG: tetratricopeptide repeat protein [Magnetococcales bacterium]|nr:tetratricopeptide repeat protein [Magnetococcales bacterium]